MNPTRPSAYEQRQWQKLEAHWEKVANPSVILPPKARAAIEAAGTRTKRVVEQTGAAISSATPHSP